ncbi:DUF3899 domain-containing protein [Heyndrickxia oleronia]|uniref:DUF3899 domain-containing protein n=1 Tax=Heyndrickxia oleronia TaxID=38875 RepID=UPI0020414760|nr:DUF3899 domain-containing protein [Heyndrickxia oleronia]MCM3239271.1 DUF3899 domain-containing protein [Heyndrickxia oleronia]
MKKYLLFNSFSFVLSLIIVLSSYQSWDFLGWINILFYIGIVILLIGCVLIIIRGNFFSAFIYSCKRFFLSINKKEQIIQETEGRQVEPPSVNRQVPSPKPWIINGFSFCILSLLLSLLMVYSGR